MIIVVTVNYYRLGLHHQKLIYGNYLYKQSDSSGITTVSVHTRYSLQSLNHSVSCLHSLLDPLKLWQHQLTRYQLLYSNYHSQY